jgi:hypothetical protein
MKSLVVAAACGASGKIRLMFFDVGAFDKDIREFVEARRWIG